MTSSDKDVQNCSRVAEVRRSSNVWVARLASGESKIPRLQDSQDTDDSSSKSSCTKDTTPPSRSKSICKVKAAAGDAATVVQTLFEMDTPRVPGPNSPRVHALANAYEQRIHSLQSQQKLAADKHHKSRLAPQPSDQEVGHAAHQQHHSQPQPATLMPQCSSPQMQRALEVQLHDASAEVDFLVQQLEEAVAAQGAAERDLASSQSELTALMLEAQQLKHQVAEAAEFQSSAATSILQLQQQLDDAHDANEQLVSELLQLRRQQEAQNSDTALTVCKAEIVLLQQHLQDARRDKQAADETVLQLKQQLTASTDSLTVLADCREEIVRLHQQLADSRQAEQAAVEAVTQLQQQLAASGDLQATLKHCQAELQQHQQAAAAAEARASQAEGSVGQLQDQLDHVKRDLAAAETDLATLQQKTAQVDQDSLANAAMLLQLQQQLDEVSVARETAEKQASELQLQLGAAEQQYETAAAEVHQLQEQLQNAAATQEALAAAGSKIQHLQQRFDSAEAAKHAAATTVLQLKEQLAKAETKIHRLEPRLRDSLIESETAKHKVLQLERALEWSQYEKRAKRSFQMEQHLKQLQKQLKETQAAHGITKHQLQEAQSEVQQLRQQQQIPAGRGFCSAAVQQDIIYKDLSDVHVDFQHERCMNKLQTEVSDSRAFVELLQEELQRCRNELEQTKAALNWASKHKVQHLFGLSKSKKETSRQSQNGAWERRSLCGALDATETAVVQPPEPVRCQSRLGGIKGLRLSNNGVQKASKHNGALWASHIGGLYGEKCQGVRVLDVGSSVNGAGLRVSTRYQGNEWPSPCSTPVSHQS